MEEQKTNGFLEKIRGWIASLGQTKDAGERVRLSRMAVKRERPQYAETGSSSRWNGQDDTDNYLLGHLLPRERHEHAVDADKCAITHWKGIECLCPEDFQQVEPSTATHIRSHIKHRDGCISSYIDETEPGMGMELDCLSCFLGIEETEPVGKIESSKKSTDPRATVKDLPAVPPRLDFSPVDKKNRRNANA